MARKKALTPGQEVKKPKAELPCGCNVSIRAYCPEANKLFKYALKMFMVNFDEYSKRFRAYSKHFEAEWKKGEI